MDSFTQSQRNTVRPQSSENMSDLHVYVVPTDLWEEQQNLAFNQIINETVSAGFIRINADTFISDLRIEIDRQLGYEVIPTDYVFCKSVGRCLAQVRQKQESILKAKHFLPPNSHCPELFVVDSIVAKRTQTTSDSGKTNFSNSDRAYLMDTYPYSSGPELRTGRSNLRDSSERDEMDKDNYLERPTNSDDEILKKDFQKRKTERNNRKFEKYLDYQTNNVEKKEDKNLPELTSSIDKQLALRRKEIDDLQKEITKRYTELESLEQEHERKLMEWEADEEKRRQEEIERRRLFEQMEFERIRREEEIIEKQKNELKNLEKVLATKREEIKNSERKLMEERENRNKIMESKQQEIENLKETVAQNLNFNPDIGQRLIEIQQEIEEMEKRQKEIEEVTMTERIDAENDFKIAERDFNNLKAQWEEEKRNRDREHGERMLEEERLREISERKRVEHEMRMEEERRRMIEERERFEEEQKHWEEERIRYEEEEKRRVEEMELAIKEAYKNKPEVQKFEIKDPDLILEGATDAEQVNHLKNILKSVINERQLVEKRRNDALKKIRSSQMFVQNRRNQIRDMWKKRYFDEKKKTPPLEDQLNRYKSEIEELHKRLMGFIESGMREHQNNFRRNGIKHPSNKANLMLQATRLQHEIEGLQQEIEHCRLRLSAEIKLRDQTETELKVLRIEAMQKKIRLSRTRSDQLAIMAAGNNALLHSYEYICSPRNMLNLGSHSTMDRFMQH